MYCTSQWYPSLACYTFPTIFIRLTADEIKAVLDGDKKSKAARKTIGKMQRSTDNLPGHSFIYADCCAPTDSALFQKRRGAINNGSTGWDLVISSEKVKDAIREGASERLCLHPYRRMNSTREFRMFVKDTGLAGMSQRYPDKHLPALSKRSRFIWDHARSFMAEIGPFLPAQDVVVDVYLTSRDQFMIIDLNHWGHTTDPLLMRTWDRDWSPVIGLKLADKPITLKGNVSVSF